MSASLVVVHADQLGIHASPYGTTVETPSMDRLAREGIVFTNAFAASSAPSPSRASFFTGLHPHEHGLMGAGADGWTLADGSRHLLHRVRRIGYRTAIVSSRYQGDYDLVIGADAGEIGPAAGRAIEELAPSPFLLVVRLADRTGDPSVLSPGDPFAPEALEDTRARAERADQAVGSVLEGLDRAGIADSTLVVVTTEHAPPGPRGKGTLYDSALRTLLLVRGPGGFGGGRRIDRLVSHVDIAPTLCDLMALPAGGSGRSPAPAVRGLAGSERSIFAEMNHNVCYKPMRAVRTSRWKLIRTYDPDVVPPDLPPGFTEMLFDVRTDREELVDLSAAEQHRPTLHDLSHQLDQWMSATADPLLSGPVIAPPVAS